MVLNVTGTLDIQSGGLIDLSRRGLGGGANGSAFGNYGETYNALGQIVQGAAGYGSSGAGGSYGGAGANGTGGTPTGAPYGAPEDAIFLGAGGGGTASGAIAGVLALKERTHETPSSRALQEGLPRPGVTQAMDVASLPKLIDLGADTCIPCKMMAPILEDLARDFSSTFELEFIDVWKRPDAAEAYQVRVIPTQIFLDASGVELFRHEGFFGKEEILEKWKELGVSFRSGGEESER